MLRRKRPALRLAHSPDPDDAFMWWPLFELAPGSTPRVESSRFRYAPVMEDIETLNEKAERGEYEITAMSCAQWPRVADRYVLTACGASMGDAYGPKLVAGKELVGRASVPAGDVEVSAGHRGPAPPWYANALREPSVTIAIPGTRTSAFATLSLLLGPGRFRYEHVPFDRIIEAVASGEYAAGVVIHEGQLTFKDAGLELLADLGQWWSGRSGLPLPLGVNTVRRDLEDEHGEGSLAEIAFDLLRSVEYALAHREESVAYALQFARGMDEALADEFIRLYVNKWTLDFGEQGRAGVEAFLRKCGEAGLVAGVDTIDFIEAKSASETANKA